MIGVWWMNWWAWILLLIALAANLGSAVYNIGWGTVWIGALNVVVVAWLAWLGWYWRDELPVRTERGTP